MENDENSWALFCTSVAHLSATDVYKTEKKRLLELQARTRPGLEHNLWHVANLALCNALV